MDVGGSSTNPGVRPEVTMRRLVLCCAPQDLPDLEPAMMMMDARGLELVILIDPEIDAAKLLDAVRQHANDAVFVVAHSEGLDVSLSARLLNTLRAERVPEERVVELELDWRDPMALLSSVESLMKVRRGKPPTPDPRERSTPVTRAKRGRTTLSFVTPSPSPAASSHDVPNQARRSPADSAGRTPPTPAAGRTQTPVPGLRVVAPPSSAITQSSTRVEEPVAASDPRPAVPENASSLPHFPAPGDSPLASERAPQLRVSTARLPTVFRRNNPRAARLFFASLGVVAVLGMGALIWSASDDANDEPIAAAQDADKAAAQDADAAAPSNDAARQSERPADEEAAETPAEPAPDAVAEPALEPPPVELVEVDAKEPGRPAAIEAALGRGKVWIHEGVVYAPRSPQKMTFHAAEELCAGLTAGDLQGWRLPTLGELNRLTSRGGLDRSVYWSGTESSGFGNRALLWNSKKTRAAPVVKGWRGAKGVCVLDVERAAEP